MERIGDHFDQVLLRLIQSRTLRGHAMAIESGHASPAVLNSRMFRRASYRRNEIPKNPQACLKNSWKNHPRSYTWWRIQMTAPPYTPVDSFNSETFPSFHSIQTAFNEGGPIQRRRELLENHKPVTRWAKHALLSAAIMISLAQTARSAVVLSITPSAPDSITVGSFVDFTVSMRSNAGNVNNLGLVGFTIAVSNSGGVFTSGTGIYSPGTHIFSAPPPSNSLPSSLVGYTYFASSAQTVSGVTPTELARFRLDTTNAAIGSHTLTFSAVDVGDISFNSIDTVAPPTVTYNVVAIPEPTAMLLTPISLALFMRRARGKNRSNGS